MTRWKENVFVNFNPAQERDWVLSSDVGAAKGVSG